MPYMPLPGEHFFSKNDNVESLFRKVLTLAAGLIIVLLCLFWEELGSREFISGLVAITSANWVVEYFFRAFTFLADNEFFILLFSVLIWCFNKTLGYIIVAVVLVAGGYNAFLKEVFSLPRPVLEGVVLPAGYAFPSGHTLLGVVSWGFLALKVKRKGFWAWAFTAMLMIGFSRLMLGYHFARDVLGGLLFGFLFLVILLYLGPFLNRRIEKTNLSSSTFMLLSVAVPLLIVLVSQVVLQRESVILFMGYISGAVFCYAGTGNNFSPAIPQERWPLQIIKILTGIPVLIVIIWGISPLLPSEALFLFPLYFLAGVWASLLAPMLFMYLGLVKLRSKERKGCEQ